MLSSVVPSIGGSRANLTVIWVRPKILRHAFRNVQMCNVRDGWPQYLAREFFEKSTIYLSRRSISCCASPTLTRHHSGTCMWWDERRPSSPDNRLAAQEGLESTITRLLQAFVDLDCPYVRCAHAGTKCLSHLTAAYSFLFCPPIRIQRRSNLVFIDRVQSGCNKSRHSSFTCRSLVLEAFQKHPQWQVLCPAHGQDQSCDIDEQHAPSAEAAASHFVWAEYERLDWERIYAGEDLHLAELSGRHHALLRDLLNYTVHVSGPGAAFHEHSCKCLSTFNGASLPALL